MAAAAVVEAAADDDAALVAAVEAPVPGETVTPVSSTTATEAKLVVIPKTALKAILTALANVGRIGKISNTIGLATGLRGNSIGCSLRLRTCCLGGSVSTYQENLLACYRQQRNVGILLHELVKVSQMNWVMMSMF